ncbi:MAG: hypothetical protein FWD49_03410 [Firmicutes bacterium]|nr:hypothetical protein [Bacillota bacterium]
MNQQPYNQYNNNQDPWGQNSNSLQPHNANNGKRNDLSLGMFIKTFLLTAIPFVGGFIFLAWLFGASKYQARINYARASFIIGLIVGVVFVIIFIASMSVFMSMLEGML